MISLVVTITDTIFQSQIRVYNRLNDDYNNKLYN